MAVLGKGDVLSQSESDSSHYKGQQMVLASIISGHLQDAANPSTIAKVSLCISLVYGSTGQINLI